MKRSGGIRRRATRLVAATIVAALLYPARATTLVQPQDLPHLVAEATRAVQVRVVNVRHGFDERRLHSTWIRAEIEQAVFGGPLPAPGETIELKLYGAPAEMPDGSRLHLDGTARLEIGGRYLLLLIGESPWGFTNTAGLGQGAFRITSGRDGRDYAESLWGMRTVLGPEGLRRWVDPALLAEGDRRWLDATRGPLPLDVLRRSILALRDREGGR